MWKAKRKFHMDSWQQSRIPETLDTGSRWSSPVKSGGEGGGHHQSLEKDFFEIN